MPLRQGDYGAFYRGVAQTVSTGAPPPVEPQESIAVIELIERMHANFG